MITLFSDSYKFNHWNQYMPGTQRVNAYFESRFGALFAFTKPFGLQGILQEGGFLGPVVTRDAISEAEELSGYHFGNKGMFNKAGWEHILNKHGGRLPVEIWAVPEGKRIPTGNALMQVRNTGGPETAFLTNFLETELTHVWYPSTVATLSADTQDMLRKYAEQTSEIPEVILPFMLHDFGYRGATCREAASRGGAAHLTNFLGTDTVVGMLWAKKYYDADYETLAFSVPATEHSVMTGPGESGELDLVRRLIKEYNSGILSVVADSFNITRFVSEYLQELKSEILDRQPNAIGLCKFVVRPDSLRSPDDTPEEQMVWITQELDRIFGSAVNKKGYKVINPKVGALWGDGIDRDGIEKIVKAVVAAGYSVDHLVFGMGGGLLQKVNRDTQRFAFKCCAQMRDDKWIDVQKNPLDKTKASKKGILKLVRDHDLDGNWEYKTINHHDPMFYDFEDEMRLVFKDGELLVRDSFDQIRARG